MKATSAWLTSLERRKPPKEFRLAIANFLDDDVAKKALEIFGRQETAVMRYITEQGREELMTRPTECCNDRSPIEEKIRLARGLFARWGGLLRQNPHIHALLEELERNIETSREAMMDLGIVEACKRCDEEEGGSCCGAGLENKFDALLLLMNILLGVPLPGKRCKPDSCYLLGERGCVLKVRLVLCVDYLCPKIMKALPFDELVRLQNISGDELTTAFILYDAIKKFMRRSSPAN